MEINIHTGELKIRILSQAVLYPKFFCHETGTTYIFHLGHMYKMLDLTIFYHQYFIFRGPHRRLVLKLNV